MTYIAAMFPDNRIRELRKKAGLTQTELGDKVGLHQTQIGKIENSDRSLTIEWSRRIATALGVRMVDLLSDEDNPHRLSAEEQRLIDQYRTADPTTRSIIERVITPAHEIPENIDDRGQNAA